MVSNQPVWLEVALNGPWSRQRQPGIPVTADEIVNEALACAAEGASIIHLHAYDPITGRQRDDYDIYAPIIERIRSQSDVICYGTLPFLGDQDALSPLTAAQRFSAVEKLVRAGLVEWSVVDPGSTHIANYDELPHGKEGFLYSNPESHVRYGLELAQTFGITPSYAIYEPGFMRLGAALHRVYAGAPIPIFRLMFTSQFTFGFPPKPWAMQAYLELLALECPTAPWMVAGLGVEIDTLIEPAVERGGHVRVGLEDAPFGHRISNVDQVRAARRKIESMGKSLASPAAVRQRLRAS